MAVTLKIYRPAGVLVAREVFLDNTVRRVDQPLCGAELLDRLGHEYAD
jgi:hypothetical protein